MEQTTARQRVELELKEYQEKISKAMDFAVKNRGKLNEAETMLLNLQIGYMKKTCEVLKARLSIWREL